MITSIFDFLHSLSAKKAAERNAREIEMCNLKVEVPLRIEKDFRLRHRYKIEQELLCPDSVHSYRFRSLSKRSKKILGLMYQADF